VGLKGVDHTLNEAKQARGGCRVGRAEGAKDAHFELVWPGDEGVPGTVNSLNVFLLGVGRMDTPHGGVVDEEEGAVDDKCQTGALGLVRLVQNQKHFQEQLRAVNVCDARRKPDKGAALGLKTADRVT